MIEDGTSFLKVVEKTKKPEDRLMILKKSYLLHKYEMYYGKNKKPEYAERE